MKLVGPDRSKPRNRDARPLSSLTHRSARHNAQFSLGSIPPQAGARRRGGDIECAFAARTGVDTGKLPLLRLLPRRRGRLLPGRCASGCAPGGPLGGERGADASPRELLGRTAIVRRLAAMVSSSRFDGRGCREALAAHQCSVCEPVAVASLVCPGVAARLCLRLCCGCVPCVTSRRATETACDRFASGAPRRCFSFCGWSRDFLGRDLFVCRERREDCWGP